MATPSLYPLYMKAQSGGGVSQVLQGELILQLEADPDIVLETEDISVSLTEDISVVIPEDDIEVNVDV